MDHTHTEVPIRKLVDYCSANDWAGYDPYDAVNSRLFAMLPILNSKWPRVILTQALKRSPVNVRPWLGIPKTQNPKAIGIFLAAFVKLSRNQIEMRQDFVGLMLERLVALRATNTDYWCWGYSFPWQTRSIVVPRGAPSLVCTTFVADALLDAYEQYREPECLRMAVSAAEYLVDKLYWTNGSSISSFCYPLPTTPVQIHNANFLAAALLGRVYALTSDSRFLDPALRVARFSARAQKGDGSWMYGEADTQQWVDNFHTGYNLCALKALGRALKTDEFEQCVSRGFDFYRQFFFREDGAPRYFHNKTFPIDIHCVAQSIITLSTFRDQGGDSLPLAGKVLGWSMKHMWDDRGFFYYQVCRTRTVKTSYMRWAQAWMLLALSTFVDESGQARQPKPTDCAVVA